MVQLANDLSCTKHCWGFLNKIASWISNSGNDWTAESAMIASDDVMMFPIDFNFPVHILTCQYF